MNNTTVNNEAARYALNMISEEKYKDCEYYAHRVTRCRHMLLENLSSMRQDGIDFDKATALEIAMNESIKNMKEEAVGNTSYVVDILWQDMNHSEAITYVNFHSENKESAAAMYAIEAERFTASLGGFDLVSEEGKKEIRYYLDLLLNHLFDQGAYFDIDKALELAMEYAKEEYSVRED